MNKSHLLRPLPLLLLTLIVLLAAGCAGAVTPTPESGATPEQSPMPAGETMTLYVGPTLADCVGVAPQKCMQVKTSPDGEYQLFYDTIQGFDYEEGYDYEITVSRTEIENPPADASKYQYTLVEVVSKTAATGGESVASKTPLENTLWKLESIVATNGLAPVLPNTQATAQFVAGRVGGNASCNTYFGEYQVDGNNLTVNVGGSTMMACEPPEMMQQEMAYLDALGKTATYEISGDRLVLKDAGGNPLLSYTAFASPPLIGTNWNVMVYNNGKGGLTSAIAGTEITLLFGEDGTVSGTTGCNNYTGGYQVDGESIVIGPLATTRRMCVEPEGIMDQEFNYTNTLAKVATYQILGDELTLLDAQGTILISAQAATDTSGQAAGETPAPTEGTLVGVVWQWIGTAYSNDTEQPVDSPNYTIQFLPDGSLQFLADCNTGGGSYLVDGSSLTLQLGAMTMMACPPDSLSDKFLAELSQVVTYVIQDGTLYLNLAVDTGNMKFVQSAAKTEGQSGEAPAGSEAPAADGSALVDTSWQWLGSASASETIAPTFPDRYQLAFQAEGKVKLRADCNTGGGSYKSDGANLGLDVAVLTRAACAKGSKSQIFVDQLNQAATYAMDGENLVITLQADAGQMKFGPAE